MMNDKLLNVLREVFNLRKEDISIDLKSDDIDNWDSLAQMDLINSLEEEFEITLDMEEIIKINSVKTMIEVLKNKGVI